MSEIEPQPTSDEGDKAILFDNGPEREDKILPELNNINSNYDTLSGEGKETKSIHEVAEMMGMDGEEWNLIAESTGEDMLQKESEGRAWLVKTPHGEKVNMPIESSILNQLYENYYSVSEHLKAEQNILEKIVYFADSKGHVQYQVYHKSLSPKEEQDTVPPLLMNSEANEIEDSSYELLDEPKVITIEFNPPISTLTSPIHFKARTQKNDSVGWEKFWKNLLKTEESETEIHKSSQSSDFLIPIPLSTRSSEALSANQYLGGREIVTKSTPEDKMVIESNTEVIKKSRIDLSKKETIETGGSLVNFSETGIEIISVQSDNKSRENFKFQEITNSNEEDGILNVYTLEKSNNYNTDAIIEKTGTELVVDSLDQNLASAPEQISYQKAQTKEKSIKLSNQVITEKEKPNNSSILETNYANNSGQKNNHIANKTIKTSIKPKKFEPSIIKIIESSTEISPDIKPNGPDSDAMSLNSFKEEVANSSRTVFFESNRPNAININVITPTPNKPDQPSPPIPPDLYKVPLTQDRNYQIIKTDKNPGKPGPVLPSSPEPNFYPKNTTIKSPGPLPKEPHKILDKSSITKVNNLPIKTVTRGENSTISQLKKDGSRLKETVNALKNLKANTSPKIIRTPLENRGLGVTIIKESEKTKTIRQPRNHLSTEQISLLKPLTTKETISKNPKESINKEKDIIKTLTQILELSQKNHFRQSVASQIQDDVIELNTAAQTLKINAA